MYASYTLSFDSMIHIARLYNDHWLKVADEWGLAVCDLESEMEPSLEHFYDDVHFNLEGSRKAAAFLEGCLGDLIQEPRSSVGTADLDEAS